MGAPQVFKTDAGSIVTITKGKGWEVIFDWFEEGCPPGCHLDVENSKYDGDWLLWSGDGDSGRIKLHAEPRPSQLAAAAFVITQADTTEGQKRAARIVAEAFPNVIEKDTAK